MRLMKLKVGAVFTVSGVRFKKIDVVIKDGTCCVPEANVERLEDGFTTYLSPSLEVIPEDATQVWG